MPTRGTAYKNAPYLKARYQDLRRLGLCVDCKSDSPRRAKCDACRRRMNLKRSVAA